MAVKSPKPTGPSWKVDRSRCESSGSVTTTSWAGAVASGSFWKNTVYPNAWSERTHRADPAPCGPNLSLGSTEPTVGRPISWKNSVHQSSE